MHTIKITPNLLFEYQCTSGKFIRWPNRIEKKIDSVARIESKLFCPNWNALSIAAPRCKKDFFYIVAACTGAAAAGSVMLRAEAQHGLVQFYSTHFRCLTTKSNQHSRNIPMM